MKIFVVDSQNVRITVHPMENSTVAILKEEIKNKCKINDDINLVYNGNILEDNEYLLNYDIEAGSVICFLGKFPVN